MHTCKLELLTPLLDSGRCFSTAPTPSLATGSVAGTDPVERDSVSCAQCAVYKIQRLAGQITLLVSYQNKLLGDCQDQ